MRTTATVISDSKFTKGGTSQEGTGGILDNTIVAIPGHRDLNFLKTRGATDKRLEEFSVLKAPKKKDFLRVPSALQKLWEGLGCLEIHTASYL